MCLIAIAVETHPLYPLIIMANRDEFYHRPTAPLAFWEDHPAVLAGRDLTGKGTWLGISTAGRISMLTNYREPSAFNAHARSRGRLVSDFLASTRSPEDYLEGIRQRRDEYNGFNLVVGDISRLWWYSNKTNEISLLSPGIHAISNHLLDTPWPKAEKIRGRMEALCRDGGEISPEILFAMLADTARPPDHTLPDTGVGLEWERILSSVFVVSPDYGTRASTVILAEASGRVLMAERTFSPGMNPPTAETTRVFTLTVAHPENEGRPEGNPPP